VIKEKPSPCSLKGVNTDWVVLLCYQLTSRELSHLTLTHHQKEAQQWSLLFNFESEKRAKIAPYEKDSL